MMIPGGSEGSELIFFSGGGGSNFTYNYKCSKKVLNNPVLKNQVARKLKFVWKQPDVINNLDD